MESQSINPRPTLMCIFVYMSTFVFVVYLPSYLYHTGLCICTVLAFAFVLYLPSYLYCTYLRFCTVLDFVFVLYLLSYLYFVLPSYLYCTCICFLVRRWVNNLEALTHESGAADLVLFCYKYSAILVLLH